jgi:hypothetical protein
MTGPSPTFMNVTPPSPPEAQPIPFVVPGWLREVGGTIRWAFILHGPILVALFYLMWGVGVLVLGAGFIRGNMNDPKHIPGALIVYHAIVVWACFAPVALIWALVRSFTGAVRDSVATVFLMGLSFWFIATNPHNLLGVVSGLSKTNRKSMFANPNGGDADEADPAAPGHR